MYRLIKYALLIIASIPVIIALLLLVPHIVNRIAPVRHNDNFSTEINRDIISLVNQLMRIHYGQYDPNVASLIFSEELLKQIESGRRFHNLREEQLFFRIIDRDYMQTLAIIASRGDNEMLFRLRVRVYGGFIDDSRLRLIHWLTIMRREDGTFVITDIDYDR